MAKNKFLFNNIDGTNIEQAIASLNYMLTHETYEIDGEVKHGAVLHFTQVFDRNDTNGNSVYHYKFFGNVHGYPRDITYEVAEILQCLQGNVKYIEKHSNTRHPYKFIKGYEDYVDTVCFKLLAQLEKYTNTKILSKHEIW